MYQNIFETKSLVHYSIPFNSAKVRSFLQFSTFMIVQIKTFQK